MKTAALSILLLGAMTMASHADDKSVSTTVRNGNSIASVTQSGDPASATRTIEKRPGYTRIEQKSGNSRSVVVQSQNPTDMPDLDAFPPELQRMFKELAK